MATVKTGYGTATAITWTGQGLNSLTNAQYTDGSDTIDNTSSLYLDALVEVEIADIVEAGNFQVVIYAMSSVDGTDFSTHTNASAQPQNLAYVGTVSVPSGTAGTWRSRAFSVAAAFGGVLPPKWKLVAYNDTGVSLAASANAAQWRGVFAQSV